MRSSLKVRLGLAPQSTGSSIELNGQEIWVKSIDVVADASSGRLTTATVEFHPENLEMDLDARCLRLNGARLPDETSRAYYEQLKKLYGDA
jgi:hypothetical protein